MSKSHLETANIPADLHPLTKADLPRIKEALDRGGCTGWAFAVSFMLAVDRGSKRTSLLWCELEGSICLFVLRTEKRPRLDLYAPPFPTHPVALRRSLERANHYNRDRSATIYWIDEQDAAMVAAEPGLLVRPKLDEYLYRPSDFADLSGTRYRNIRRYSRLIESMPGLEVRPYQQDDAAECLALLEYWEGSQGKKYAALRDRAFTRACFELAPELDDLDLYGEVYRLEGRIRAFSFGGEIRKGLGNFLVGKSDPEVCGLSHFIWLHFLRNMKAWELVNDGSDMGSEGLRQHKLNLRPCGMHSMFRAKQG